MATRKRSKRPTKPPLVVIDTLVVSAIIGTPNNAAYALMRAVETGEVRLAVSDDWLRELVRVLESPRIADQINLKRTDQPEPSGSRSASA